MECEDDSATTFVDKTESIHENNRETSISTEASNIRCQLSPRCPIQVPAIKGLHSATSSKNSFTLAFWFHGGQNAEHNAVVCSIASAKQPLCLLGLVMDTVSKRLRIYMSASTAKLSHIASSKSRVFELAEKLWTHISVVYKEKEKKLKLFVNGMLDKV